MAANNVQVVLGFQADTKQAKAAISDLASSLEKVKNINLQSLGMDSEIRRASEAAQELQNHLQQAVNFNTGKLDLTKFNNSIKQSGQSLENLLVNLQNGGTAGAEAFGKLASSIAQSEVPLKRLNSTLQNVMTTLKNTAKWEISSKLIHGIESTFSGAVSYVKDLDSALNDIRIVTGKSADEMSKFALEANKMAQVLSTTTKEYTKASLIYFQQGDDQATAMQKAAITTKAANVAFTASAQEMSDMLTAVWNSYQVGTDQLEHTVDVMAALGATTASSMEEMATAMQKVAATANTVGVSMEQMSAMVATSASVTKQAPQVIGTAWNTILSRIGGLKLGETLEDGVDLNKYSKALKTVGVDVLDTTGNLRAMGDVVNELGAKWNELSVAQQSALAQTIGGVRQYTQLMAFFENFDKYQANLNTANSADGELQRQADIYAESWEAASKRVKATLESLYSSLISDKGLIGLENTFNTILKVVSDIVSQMGGLSGVATTISSVLIAAFANKIPAGLKNIGNAISGIFVDPKKQYQQALNEESAALSNAAGAGVGQQATIDLTQQLIERKRELLNIEDGLSSAQAESMQRAMSLIGNQISQVSQLEQQYSTMTTAIDQGAISLERMATQAGSLESYFQNANQAFQELKFKSINDGAGWDTSKSYTSQLISGLSKTTQISTAAYTASNTAGIGAGNGALDTLNWDSLGTITEQNTGKITTLINQIELLKEATKGTQWENLFSGFDTSILKTETNLETLNSETDEMRRKVVNNIQQMTSEVEQEASSIETALRNAIDSLPEGQLKTDIKNQLDELKQQVADGAITWEQYKMKLQEVQGTLDATGEKMKQLNTKFNNVASSIGKLASAAGSSLALMRGFSSTAEAISSGTFSVSNGLTLIVSLLPAIVTGIKAVQAAATAASFSNIFTAIASIAVMLGGAIYGIIDGIDKAEKAANEKATQYASKKYTTESKETISETDESLELIKNYNTLYDTYMQTGEGQEQLIESAQKLAEVYGIIGANVLLANGEFEKFNEKLIEQIGFDKQISALKGSQSGLLSTIGNNTKGGIYSIGTNDKYKDVRENLQTDTNDYTYSSGIKRGGVLTGLNYSSVLDRGANNTWIDTNTSDNTYTLNTAAVVQWVDEFSRGNSELKAKLEQAIIDDLYGSDYLDLAQDKTFIEALDYFNEDFTLNHAFYERKPGNMQDYGSSIITNLSSIVGDINESTSAAVYSMFEAQAGELENNLETLFDNEGNFKWDTATGQERIGIYRTITDEKDGLLVQLTNTINNLRTEMDETTDEETKRLIQQKIDYYTQIQDSFKELFVNDKDTEGSMANTLSQYIENEKKIAQYELNNMQLKSFVGKGEHDTKFKDFATGYSQVVNAIEENVLTLYEDEFKDLIDIDENAENGYKYKEGMQDAFNNQVTKLADEFFNSVTAFGNYSSIFSTLRYSGLTDHTDDISSLIEERDLTMSDFTSNLITAIKNFYRRVKDGSIVDDEYITNLIDEQNEQDMLNNAEAKQSMLSSASSKLKSGMSISDAKKISSIFEDEEFASLYNDYMANINGDLLISFNEFLELDKNAKTEYLKTVNENYSKALQQAAEESAEATELQTQAKEGIESIVSDVFDTEGNIDQKRVGLYQTGFRQFDSLYTKQDNGQYKAANGELFASQEEAYKHFVGENGEGKNLFANVSFDDFNLLQQYLNNYQTATNDIEANNALANALLLVNNMAEDATDNISKLSSAFSSLPTSASDMSSLLSLLSDNNLKYTVKDSSGNRVMTRNYTAQDLFGLSDSERESLMIEAAKAEYAKLTDEKQKAIKANEIKQMEDTHATNEQNRDLRDETTLLSQLKSEASALSSIDIAKAPKAGTAAYKALNKEIQDMNKYLNATDLEKVGMLYSAQRSNLQEQISTQQMFADRYNTKADGTSYGFTLDQDITKLDATEFAQWQKWSAVQQEIVALQEKITESYESESEKRITILEAEADAIQTRLSKAKEEAQKLETAASTLSNAVETGKLTATDKLNLSDEQIAKWDTLTTAEKRAAYAAQLYADAVIASNDAYEEYNKSIQTARDILTSKISNGSWMSDYYNQKVTSSSDFTKIFGNNETLLSAYESAIKDKTIDSSSTVGEVIKAVQTKLTEMGEEGETAAKKIEAAGVDAMLTIYQTAVEKEQSAADQAVQAWQEAFDTIAAARKAMYEDNELSEDVLTDPTKLATLAKSAGYTSTKDFMNDYRSGKITGESFKQLQYDQELFEQQAGINTLQKAFINGTDANGHEIYGPVSYEDAINRLLSTGVAKDNDNAELILQNALTQMLKASGIEDENEIATAIEQYKNKAEKSAENMFQAMATASDNLEVTGENKEMFDKYHEQESLTIQAQNEYTQATEQAQKDLEKYQNYSSLATSVMGRSSGTLAATTLGEDAGTMLAAMNELLGTNKASVEAFTPEQWSQAAATWDSMAVQEQTKIASAGDTLAATLEEIAAKIAEIMGVDSVAAQNASKTAEGARETATEDNQKVSSLETAARTGTTQRWANYAGVDETKMDDLAAAFEDLDKNTTILNEDTIEYREALYKCAAMAEQTRAALVDLTDSYKDNVATLKKGQTSTDDYIEAMDEVKENIANIFNVEKKYITDDFVTEHLEDYEDLGKGVEGASEKIANAIKDNIIAPWKDNKIDIPLELDTDGINDGITTAGSILDSFINQYANEPIGFNIDTGPAIEGLNALLSSGVATADQITAALNAIGWSPQIEYDEYDIISQDPVSGTITYEVPGIDGTLRPVTGNASGLVVSNGKVKVPRIGSAGVTKVNNSGSTTPSSSSSSGGGGGSNKNKQKKDSHDQTRYHQTDRLIKNQNDLLTINDKLKSRKYGTSYIDSLKKENSLLEDQIELNEEKIKEANAYLQQDKQELLSLGATFDAEGNINYDAYQDYWDSLYNSKVDAYNAGSLDDDAWTDFEEQYNNAMDAVENYEEAQDRIAEAQQEILELQNQISANLKEMVVYKMNLTIDLNDRELKLLENLIKRYENDLKEQANNYGHYMEEMNNYLENLGAEQTAIDDLLSSAGLNSLEEINGIINGMLNGGKMTVADFADGLDEIYDKLLNDLDAIVELRQEMLEFYANTLEKGEEELEHWTNTLAHQINMMEKYKTILDLISDGKHYQQTNEILQQQYDTGMKQIEIDQEKLKVYYEEREKLQSILYNPDGTINEKAEGDLKALEEQIQQTEENIMQNAEATMKYAQELFTNTIDQIFDDLDRLNTATGETLSWIKQTKWDWWKEDQDQFVDSITEVYEIDKLTRKIEQSIAESRSKYNQEQLKALENEIQLRSEANDLTQYDLKMMEYSYELLLARQNLENAQNAKDTVRLTRDENGNMIYQYTTDQDKLAEAQQKYNDVLYEMNQTTKERYRDLMDTLFKLREDEENAIKEVLLDTSLSEEEKLAHIEEIKKRYAAQISIIQDQLNIATENMLYNQEAFSERFSQNLIDNTSNTQQQVNLELKEMIADANKWNDDVEKAIGDSITALWNYEDQIGQVAESAGASWNHITERMQYYKTESEKAREEAGKVTQTLKEQLAQLTQLTANWSTFDAQLQARISYFQNLASQINTATAALQALHEEESRSSSGSSTGGDGGYTGGSGSGNGNGSGSGNGNTGGSPSGGGKTSWTAYYEYSTPQRAGNVASGTAVGNSDSEAKAAAAQIARGNVDHYYIGASLDGPYYHKNYLTGGLADFTGPAWLDGSKTKPEYVLNADQTEQMFGILNSNTITRLIDTMTMATRAMMAGLGLTSSGSIINNNSNRSSNGENTYYITANFPDAKDHAEIELALQNLMNYSSQQYNSLTL